MRARYLVELGGGVVEERERFGVARLVGHVDAVLLGGQDLAVHLLEVVHPLVGARLQVGEAELLRGVDRAELRANLRAEGRRAVGWRGCACA